MIIGLFSHQILWFKLSQEYPSYRIENYFFSWGIARQHPLLGIGLSSPRDRFLQDYQIKYPYENREKFAGELAIIHTPDNQLLTFLYGLGFPFTLIYFLAVLTLLVKLVGMAFRPPPGLYFPPLALLFPLAAALIHFQFYDGLLFPQSCWFFHILLSLIPAATRKPGNLNLPTVSRIIIEQQTVKEDQEMNLKNTLSDYLAACPACDSPIMQSWLTKEMGGLTFKLDRCCVCGTGYVNPRPSLEYLKSIYSITGHGSKSLTSFDEVMAAEIEFPNSTVDAQRIIKYAQKLLGPRKNLRLLDIGSGYGFFSRAGIVAGFQVTAINPASSENSIFKQLNGFEPIPQLFEEVDLGAEKFDLVILSQILEHFLDPRQILLRVNSLLNRGGVVAIAVPNIDTILIKILKSRSSFLGFLNI